MGEPGPYRNYQNRMSGDHRMRRGNYRPQHPGRRFPDRWLNYDSVGRDMEGTRFVAFKTPLDPSFFEGKPDLHPELHFDVRKIVNFAQGAGKKLGLVIDLTNTDKYYKKHEWADHDIQYSKIFVPGHEVNGREDIVQDFIARVQSFVSDSANDGKLIGVHCTHGLNRTGYLICRYLIDVEGYTANDAISLFEFSRGHPIERGHYKKALYEAENRKKQKTENSVRDALNAPLVDDSEEGDTADELTESAPTTVVEA